VWVAFFTDGEVGGDGVRAVGGEAEEGGEAHAFQDWSFEVIKIAGFLLSHGAQLVYTAEDAYNPSVDPKHPGLVFPLPGPGMFAAMMRKLMYPYKKDAIACAGKGGNQGGTYMMEAARRMLIAQGHDGDPTKILMVGDRFDTDVRAGLSSGFSTCLVTSGCHSLGLQQHYLTDPVHFHAPGVGALVPYEARATRLGGVSATAGVRVSVHEAVGNLQAWMLQQSSILKPGASSAAETRTALREVLRQYFSAVDVNDNGHLDPSEIEAALGQQGDQVGMGQLQLQLLQKLRSRLRASLVLPPSEGTAEGGVSFDQFTEVMEEGLADCGFHMRPAADRSTAAPTNVDGGGEAGVYDRWKEACGSSPASVISSKPGSEPSGGSRHGRAMVVPPYEA